MLFPHPIFSVLFLVEGDWHVPAPLINFFKSIPHLKFDISAQLVGEISKHDVIVTRGTPKHGNDYIEKFVENGGSWFVLLDLSENNLPTLFGAQPEPVGPVAELRILFKSKNHPLSARLPEAFYFPGRYHALKITDGRCETILYADWLYSQRAVLTSCRTGKGYAACTTLQAYEHPGFHQILYRILRALAGHFRQSPELNVGILGYSPNVGKSHGMGVCHTPGLTLMNVCDLSSQRLNQAKQDFPDVKTCKDADELCRDPDVELVIVTTPPDTHAKVCMQLMNAGKHVVCEKPLVLTHAEANMVFEMANQKKVHLSCHQNRRWDTDFLAIKQAVAEGLIGDLFYLETFVGSFNHPCGYWHSHAPVCGGTSYDWGAHYLDWVVSLIPDQIESVVATRQKRVWHDITNADQERIQLKFVGGQEADFMHSDIAAVRKPKWYLLGTKGAIVGTWQDVSAFAIDPILYFHKHDIPATEMPPKLTLYRRHHTGQVLSQEIAMPTRESYPFHRNLADHMLVGEPLVAPLSDSIKVVNILEAAARSMSKGGTVEVLHNG